VVPDQLRISQGWVKCGQCGDIFDAAQHLVEVPTAVEIEEPTLPEPSHSESLVAASIDVPEQAASEWGTGVAARQDKRNSVAEVEVAGSEQTELQVESALGHEVPHNDETQAHVNEAEQSPLSASDSRPLDVDDIPVPASFMSRADKPVFWHRKLVRVFLSMLGSALCVSLAGQWVYQERDRLAVMYPSWHSGLTQFCDAAGCAIRPLQQIESIAIDSAAFSKVGRDQYRLSLTVKNQANFPLAMPSIELTLTDLQDQAIIRKILLPHDLAALSDHLAPVSEWPVAVTVAVAPEAKTSAVVGYRLLAFYP
jgi:hypothetical protein